MTQVALQGVTTTGYHHTWVPSYPMCGTALHQPRSSRESPCQPTHTQFWRQTRSAHPGPRRGTLLCFVHLSYRPTSPDTSLLYPISCNFKEKVTRLPLLYFSVFILSFVSKDPVKRPWVPFLLSVSKQAEEQVVFFFSLNLILAYISTLRPKLSPAFLPEEVLRWKGLSVTSPYWQANITTSSSKAGQHQKYLKTWIMCLAWRAWKQTWKYCA